MSLDDDLDHTAVTIVAVTLAAYLPNTPATLLEVAAVETVAAVRPYLDGTERRRVTTGSDDVDDHDGVIGCDDAVGSSLG